MLAAVKAWPGRQFRRYREHYEEHGEGGLLDRLGKPSPKRVPACDAQLMLELCDGAYRGWNVKHFHEQWCATTSGGATRG